ncbi:hypothetical protein ADUPG1_013973 [Aduncisulcus paluster]|nr:hypothetical protein ADUPG1_013973 [Aduncisulcus paluster]
MQYPCYIYLMKYVNKQVSVPFTMTWLMMCFSLVIQIFLALPKIKSFYLSISEIPSFCWWGVAYCGVFGSVIGYGCCSLCNHHIHSMALYTSLMLFLTFFNAIAGVFILDEDFTWWEGVGGSFICIGMVFVVFGNDQVEEKVEIVEEMSSIRDKDIV